MEAPRPLTGLTVLDASRVLAGPYLAMLLGDLGAGVIKVEKPGGDQTRGWGPPFVGDGGERVSAYFAAANRNKRSRVLDLTSPAGRTAFHRLAATADVLVENFLPAEWRKLGFDPEEFRRANQRLVHCSISGYGSQGPERDRPAYDLIVQAEAGLMGVTGFATGEPVRVGVAIVDLLTAHYGLSGVLAALYERERTGVGRRVEVVMVDTAAAFLSYAAQGYLADRREPPRLGSRHPNLVPYGAFPAADGWLAVGAGSETQWRRLCRALGREEWTEDPRYGTNEERVRHRGELEARLTEIFATAPVARWCEVFRAHEVPAGPVATLGTAVEAARERGQVVELPAGSGGVLPTVAAPWLFDGLRVTPAGGVPALGEGGGPAPETTP